MSESGTHTHPFSMKFRIGDWVEKASGYSFPGIVRAAFRTTVGEPRYVVECRVLPGLLHIFSGDQLKKETDYESR